jgi:hypothetical protein
MPGVAEPLILSSLLYDGQASCCVPVELTPLFFAAAIVSVTVLDQYLKVCNEPKTWCRRSLLHAYS